MNEQEKQEKRENVIEDLALVKRRIARLDGFAEEAEVIDDVIALLKAQQPRVMNIHEVHSRLLQNRIEREPFYVEVKNKFIACMVNESAMDLPDTDLREILYGKTWRCWTSRPTNEQRKAVKWG